MFNIGDEVKIVGTDYHAMTGVIISVTQTKPCKYRVLFDNSFHECNFQESELEKIYEYELNKPYLWTGGECPLPPKTKVMTRRGDSNMDAIQERWSGPWDVSAIDWEHISGSPVNLVLFKVISYDEPKEVTLKVTDEEIKIIEKVLNRKIDE